MTGRCGEIETLIGQYKWGAERLFWIQNTEAAVNTEIQVYSQSTSVTDSWKDIMPTLPNKAKKKTSSVIYQPSLVQVCPALQSTNSLDIPPLTKAVVARTSETLNKILWCVRHCTVPGTAEILFF